jgi:hypothetical protein
MKELEALKAVFQDEAAQKGLVTLYALSQSECTRNGKCGMEIGMAREKDQGALLKYYLGDAINLELSNNLAEDYAIGTQKISAKHAANKVGFPVKIKWTAENESVQKIVKTLLTSEQPHLLITYMDIKNGKITIICITAEHNKQVISELKEEAFHWQNGNSRGIEYSKKAMSKLLENRYFTIEINGDLKGGMDPIKRRMKLLSELRNS